MEKNPFSIYDFFGYLFPGFFFLMLFVIFIPFQPYDDVESYFKLSNLVKVCNQQLGLNELSFGETSFLAIVIIIFAYVLGHVLSYLSSMTVEYFTTRMFDYPSSFLLNEQAETLPSVLRSYFVKRTSFWVVVYRIMVALTIFPIFTFILILGWEKSNLLHFIVRPLDDYLRDNIQEGFIKMRDILRLSNLDVNHNIDFHRIVMHFVFLNIPESHSKTNNYLSLYGFLRAMALCFCLLFDYLLVKFIQTINIEYSIDWAAIMYLSFIYFFSVIMFLGFVKFYRRFTLENYMALIAYDRRDFVNQVSS